MLGSPTTEADVFYRDWRALNVEYLLIGRVSGTAPLQVEYELFDVLRQTRILTGTESGPAGDARMLAHRVADAVYEKLTGIPGVIFYTPYQPENAPLTLAKAVGWRAEKLPLEPSLTADGEGYLQHLDRWVAALSRAPP